MRGPTLTEKETDKTLPFYSFTVVVRIIQDVSKKFMTEVGIHALTVSGPESCQDQ